MLITWCISFKKKILMNADTLVKKGLKTFQHQHILSNLHQTWHRSSSDQPWTFDAFLIFKNINQLQPNGRQMTWAHISVKPNLWSIYINLISVLTATLLTWSALTPLAGLIIHLVTIGQKCQGLWYQECTSKWAAGSPMLRTEGWGLESCLAGSRWSDIIIRHSEGGGEDSATWIAVFEVPRTPGVTADRLEDAAWRRRITLLIARS